MSDLRISTFEQFLKAWEVKYFFLACLDLGHCITLQNSSREKSEIDQSHLNDKMGLLIKRQWGIVISFISCERLASYDCHWWAIDQLFWPVFFQDWEQVVTNPALGVVVGINHKSSSLMMATDFNKHAGLVKISVDLSWHNKFQYFSTKSILGIF